MRCKECGRSCTNTLCAKHMTLFIRSMFGKTSYQKKLLFYKMKISSYSSYRLQLEKAELKQNIDSLLHEAKKCVNRGLSTHYDNLWIEIDLNTAKLLHIQYRLENDSLL